MPDENMLFAKTEETELEDVAEGYGADEEKFLVFLADRIFYGVKADYVVEILTEVSITRVPMVPGYVSGVINLRGQIVPIIDFRQLLGRMPSENYCAIILNINETSIGILVDEMDRMVDIPKDIILPVPAKQEGKLVYGMCTMPGGTSTVMLLECPELVNGHA